MRVALTLRSLSFFLWYLIRLMVDPSRRGQSNLNTSSVHDFINLPVSAHYSEIGRELCFFTSSCCIGIFCGVQFPESIFVKVGCYPVDGIFHCDICK